MKDNTLIFESREKSRLAETEKFKYHAGRDSRNRPVSSSIYITGDQEFTNTSQRQKIWSQASDLFKNLSIIQFAVETHLDYICNYKLKARTPDVNFNKVLEKYLATKTKAENFDVTKKFSVKEMARLHCKQKIVFGDSLIIKTKKGLQLVDPQMITKYAEGVPDEVSIHGVVSDEFGAINKFCLTYVDKDNARRFYKLYPAKSCIYSAYLQNPTATRGVSPLVTVLNEAQDLMDLQLFSLLKAKLQSCFGVAVFRDSINKGAHDFDYNQDTNVDANEKLDFNIGPAMKFSLSSNDKVEMIESKTPNSTYESFVNNIIRSLLAPLQMPVCMFDSRQTSYSANRMDMYNYKFAIEKERESFYNVLDSIYDFVLFNGIVNEEISLPPGITFDNIEWSYIPRTNFVLDATKETQAIIDKINAGLISREAAMIELGITDSFEDTLDKIAYEQEQMKLKGVTVQLTSTGNVTTDQPSQPTE